MDSQIKKVHSPTIFCVVPRDLMGFLDASFFPFLLSPYRGSRERLTSRVNLKSRIFFAVSQQWILDGPWNLVKDK